MVLFINNGKIKLQMVIKHFKKVFYPHWKLLLSSLEVVLIGTNPNPKSVTSMLVTAVRDQMFYWHVTSPISKVRRKNIKYQPLTSHSVVLWCWWPMLVPKNISVNIIYRSPTCIKFHQLTLFSQHLKIVTIIKLLT